MQWEGHELLSQGSKKAKRKKQAARKGMELQQSLQATIALDMLFSSCERMLLCTSTIWTSFLNIVENWQHYDEEEN